MQLLFNAIPIQCNQAKRLRTNKSKLVIKFILKVCEFGFMFSSIALKNIFKFLSHFICLVVLISQDAISENSDHFSLSLEKLSYNLSSQIFFAYVTVIRIFYHGLCVASLILWFKRNLIVKQNLNFH